MRAASPLKAKLPPRSHMAFVTHSPDWPECAYHHLLMTEPGLQRLLHTKLGTRLPLARDQLFAERSGRAMVYGAGEELDDMKSAVKAST
jgi:hypothetical protein